MFTQSVYHFVLLAIYASFSTVLAHAEIEAPEWTNPVYQRLC